jgi:hypothetical protein
MSSLKKRTSRDEEYEDSNKKYKESDEFIEPDECQLCGNEIKNDEGFQHCQHAPHSHKKCLKQWITRSGNNKCLQCFQSYTNKNLADIGIDNSQQREDEMRQQRLRRIFEERRLARDPIHQAVLNEMGHQGPMDEFTRRRYEMLREWMEEQQRMAEIRENEYARYRLITDFKNTLVEVFRQINANNIENVLNRMKRMYEEFNLNLQLNNEEKTEFFKEFYKSSIHFLSQHISNKTIEFIFNINNTDINSVTFTRFETGAEERYTYEPIRVNVRDAIMPFSCVLEPNNVRPIDVVSIEFNGDIYDNKYVILDKINDPIRKYGNNHPFIIYKNNNASVYRTMPLIISEHFVNILSRALTGQATINSFIRLFNMQTYTMHVTLDSMSEPYIQGERNNNNNNSACSIMGGMKRRGSRRGSKKGSKRGLKGGSRRKPNKSNRKSNKNQIKYNIIL